MHDPVNHIGTRRVGQGALIMVEGVHFVFRRLYNLRSPVRKPLLDTSNLRRCECIEQFSETDLFDQSEIQGSELLDKWMTIGVLFE